MSNNAETINAEGHSRVHVGNIYQNSPPEGTAEQIDNKYLASLRSTDPREDKIRIENSKGGLLHDSFRWVLQNPEYLSWRNDEQHRLLWIKGDPGKGKTMLLCGIINELESHTKLKDATQGNLLSYFFCQATDRGLDNAGATLRGLVYLLAVQQPSLISYIRKRYHDAGDMDPNHRNSWVSISQVLSQMLDDPALKNSYLIVDALDECETDRTLLLKFIAANQSNVKWIVSSRNRPEIQEHLGSTSSKVALSLELNEASVSEAVGFYIQHMVDKLVKDKNCDSDEKAEIQSYLSWHAHNTFLWVALVCQELEKCEPYELLECLKEFPPELNSLYERQMNQLCVSRSKTLYKRILAIAFIVFRPITVKELMCLGGMHNKERHISIMVKGCGSFLTLRNNTIYFVHQSGKDFLRTTTIGDLFPSGVEQWHYTVYEISLKAMGILKKDMYGWVHPGTCIHDANITRPDPDPLASLEYSCVYWVDHFIEGGCLADGTRSGDSDIVRGYEEIHQFIIDKFLFWVEALSLCRKLSFGVLALSSLNQLFAEVAPSDRVSDYLAFVGDAYRFIRYFRPVIEDYPLQTYASGLVFSPTRSLVRQRFEKHGPEWIALKPDVESDWSARLEVLECGDEARSLVFQPDGQLAILLATHRLLIWDRIDGTTKQTTYPEEGYTDRSALSPDCRWLVNNIYSNGVRLWDVRTSAIKWTLDQSELKQLLNHSDGDGDDDVDVSFFRFSPDCQWLAICLDQEVVLWNMETSKPQHTVLWKDDPDHGTVLTFSHDGQLVAFRDVDEFENPTVCALDVETGGLRVREYVDIDIMVIEFLPNTHQAMLSDAEGQVWLWDIHQKPSQWLLRLQSSSMEIEYQYQLAFSSDGRWQAAETQDKVVVQDVNTRKRLLVLPGGPTTMTFSPNGEQLAVAYRDGTVGLCDVLEASKQKSSGQSLSSDSIDPSSVDVQGLEYSDEGHWLALLFGDGKVSFWNADTGAFWRSFQGQPSRWGWHFSSNARVLVSTFESRSIHVWDPTADLYRFISAPNPGFVSAVAISHSGLLVAAMDLSNTVWILDAYTGRQLKSTKYPDRKNHLLNVVMAFSPDDKWLGVTYDGGKVFAWELESTGPGISRELPSLAVYSHPGLAFSPNEQWLAIAIMGRVHLWDFRTNTLRMTWVLPGIPPRISFANDSTIVTGLGLLDLNDSGQMTNESPELRGIGFNCPGLVSWITWNGRNALWLPTEYRPRIEGQFRHGTGVAATNMVAIGCPSGRLLVIRFSPDADNYLNG